MKTSLALALLALSTLAAHAQYQQVNLTVFGMDCAPCAHAIHVSMMGIKGVDKVDVDLNTGLVSVKLNSDNTADMHQFNNAVERNGFTHKDAIIIVRGKLSGKASAPVLEVTGTPDRYALQPSTPGLGFTELLGKNVTVTGVLPQSSKGKVSGSLKVTTITEAQ